MMIDMAFLIQHSLIYGAILSALMSAFLLITVRINPAIMAGDYPPDVKEKYGPLSPETNRQKRIASIVMFPVILAPPIVSLIVLAQAGGDVPFWQLALSTFIVVFTFNVVDWLILDWLFFVTIQPRWIILPGTEGMAGYRDYAFHFRGFLIGTVFSAVTALVFGGIAWLLMAIF